MPRLPDPRHRMKGTFTSQVGVKVPFMCPGIEESGPSCVPAPSEATLIFAEPARGVTAAGPAYPAKVMRRTVICRLTLPCWSAVLNVPDQRGRATGLTVADPGSRGSAATIGAAHTHRGR